MCVRGWEDQAEAKHMVAVNDRAANATAEFPSNYFKTTKYTLLTFLPLVRRTPPPRRWRCDPGDVCSSSSCMRCVASPRPAVCTVDRACSSSSIAGPTFISCSRR